MLVLSDFPFIAPLAHCRLYANCDPGCARHQGGVVHPLRRCNYRLLPTRAWTRTPGRFGCRRNPTDGAVCTCALELVGDGCDYPATREETIRMKAIVVTDQAAGSA